MPRGPKGERRPADVIGNAVHVMRIATGEIEESFFADDGKNKAAQNSAGWAVRPGQQACPPNSGKRSVFNTLSV